VKNFMTVTLLSLGLPMILMGDEVRRTQRGNNNAYCHDNEANWFDWSLLEKHADIHRFVKLLIARRSLRDSGPERQRMSLTQLIHQGIKGWHGVKLNQPDWSDHSHSVALSAQITNEGLLVHFIFNAYWEPLDFELPRISSIKPALWRRWIDTSHEAPEDIVPWQESPIIREYSYRAASRSVIVLWARLGDEATSGT
jgi:glycogen operon protein